MARAQPQVIDAIDKIRDDLVYRTPTSNKPLAHIVLSREQAERLVTEWDALAANSSSIATRPTPWRWPTRSSKRWSNTVCARWRNFFRT